MSQLVCSVAGLTEPDAAALRRALHSAEAELEDCWAVHASVIDPPDVELIDVDEVWGRQLWTSHRFEPPLAVALSGEEQFGSGWTLHKPIEAGPVASLFNELAHSLRGGMAALPAPVPAGILLVHGDEEVLGAIRQALKVQPGQAPVHTASNGRDALAVLGANKIGLAIVSMPLRNGFELLAALRDRYGETLRVVCGGPGVAASQVAERCLGGLSKLPVEASLQAFASEILGVLDLIPAESGFLHRCSTWMPPSWSARNPPAMNALSKPAAVEPATPGTTAETAAPVVSAAPQTLSLRDQLASEVVDFEFTHFTAPAIEIAAPVAEMPPVDIGLSFTELVEEGFLAFRAKDYYRAEECWTKALEREPGDGAVAYNLRIAQKRREEARTSMMNAARRGTAQ